MLNVVFDDGSGSPIVMLHGVENDGRFWIDTARRLSVAHRVICLDLLGFGHSPCPDIAYTVDEHADAVEATVDDLLGPAALLTLVGHSLGAIIAARCAARRPERIERLVLFGPPVRHDHIDPGPVPADRLKAAFVRSVPAMRATGVALTSLPPAGAILGTTRLGTYRSSLRSIENTIEREDVASDLRAASGVPVTVVYGASDPYVVPAHAESLAEVREGIEVVRVDSAHDVAHIRPAETLAAIDADLVG